MGPVKDAAGYTGRAAASDFPGETFCVLKEKKQKYGTRRLVLRRELGWPKVDRRAVRWGWLSKLHELTTRSTFCIKST
jgi:hypothetical protein